MASPANIRLLWFEVAFLLIAKLCICGVSADGLEDPVQIVARALACFDDRVVYSRCDYQYRLSVSGNLNIPEAQTDAYCSGPCLEETDLVLHCVDQIMDNFLFYNRATIRDIRDTVHDGCGHSRWRGNFNVFDHMREDESKGTRSMQQRGSLLLTLLGLSLTVPLLLSCG
ncbi:uncharacterized protein LOC116254948 [Nymphaea colorata]|nr:uncharacterized protein LOC116254948 [Nymphaea colorata]